MEEHNQPLIHNGCPLMNNNASNGTNSGEHSGASSTNSPGRHISADDVLQQPETRVPPYRANLTVREDGDGNAITTGGIGWISRDEICPCVAIVLTFGFFVCMVMILGVYGPMTVILGPNSSILIKPNSIFVEYVKIEEAYKEGSDDGTILLYGFHKAPPLDVALTWSDTHNITLQSTAHKDWIYYLNKGSHINISFSAFSTTNSSSVIFAIARGYEGLNRWLESPSHPNATLYWEVIQGNGMIQQDIYTSSNYYIALENLDDVAASVQLNMRFRSWMYNTRDAYDKCCISNPDGCSVKISLGGGNAALLTSPGPLPGRAVNEWYVKLSYGPRWISYVAVIGGISMVVLGAIHLMSVCMNGFGRIFLSRGEIVVSPDRMIRTPLVLPPSTKDDDLSSWGSSYDSVLSQDDEKYPTNEDLQEGNGENNTRRLCAICFDAPRDCFFLPCGHYVACFACSTRIAEAAGTCPICRRPMKKVRKIFTV